MFIIAFLTLVFSAYHLTLMFANLDNPRVSHHAFRVYGALLVFYCLIWSVI